MGYLTVLYDPGCGLCTRAAAWLQGQPQFIGLRIVPSTEAARVHPALASVQKELVVVREDGGMYLGERAWLICLYALKRYRSLALRLSRPALLPFASRAFKIVSANRHRVSEWLEGLTDGEVQVELGKIYGPRCHGTDC